MKHAILGSLVAASLAAGACATSSDPAGSSSSTPTAPAAAPVTENFTGTVPVGLADFNPFTVATSNNPINVTLTAAGPPATIYMGLGVGSPVGGACQLLSGGSTVTQAGAAAQLSGTIVAGTYCVIVYDAGNMVAPVTYAVTVTHY